MDEQNRIEYQEESDSSPENRLNDLAADMAGIEAVLNMIAESEACNAGAGDALYLIAKSARRINTEVCEIAAKVQKPA